MAKIPFKPGLMKIRRKTIKWIIIHHTVELYQNPQARIDNAQYQLSSVMNGVMELKQPDVNYHYVIDKIKDDYVPIVCRPFAFLCDWDDIDTNINQRSLHVALLGSYNVKIPEKRLLEVLAYKILNPYLKLFTLPVSRIKLHNEISTNKELTCPGIFIDKAVIISMVKKFVVK